MAQLLPIKMSKFDNQPWGFRIQGGIDFAAPLTVQKVNGGSLAEKAGLCVGDNLIRVNSTDIYQMRHKEAQDNISKAGNNFELVVSRGGLKPKVASAPLPLPTSSHPPPTSHAEMPAASQVAAGQQFQVRKSLNFTARPYQLNYESNSNNNNNNNNIYVCNLNNIDNNGTKAVRRLSLCSLSSRDASMVISPLNSPTLSQSPLFYPNDGQQQRLVNKQFNSPMAMYSEENIAETLSSQAEVLAQGVLGVNFKKNEKTYDPANSEVFKMLQEMARQPKEAEPGIDIDPADASPAQKGLLGRNIQSRTFKRLQETVDGPSGMIASKTMLGTMRNCEVGGCMECL